MSLPKNPSLYQINTVILLQELSTKLKRKATLDDVPNELFSDLKRRGFDFVWFLGVWQKGEASVAKSREGASKYKSELPDLTTEDVVGSPFAISAYQLSSSFGDRQALKRLHDRVNKNNMRLILDFVPVRDKFVNFLTLQFFRWRDNFSKGNSFRCPVFILPKNNGFMQTPSTDGVRFYLIFLTESRGSGPQMGRGTPGIFDSRDRRAVKTGTAKLYKNRRQNLRLRSRSLLRTAGPIRSSSTTGTKVIASLEIFDNRKERFENRDLIRNEEAKC